MWHRSQGRFWEAKAALTGSLLDLIISLRISNRNHSPLGTIGSWWPVRCHAGSTVGISEYLVRFCCFTFKKLFCKKKKDISACDENSQLWHIKYYICKLTTKCICQISTQHQQRTQKMALHRLCSVLFPPVVTICFSSVQLWQQSRSFGNKHPKQTCMQLKEKEKNALKESLSFSIDLRFHIKDSSAQCY